MPLLVMDLFGDGSAKLSARETGTIHTASKQKLVSQSQHTVQKDRKETRR